MSSSNPEPLDVRFGSKADIAALSELALRFSLAPLSVPPLLDPPQTENKVPGVAAKTRAHAGQYQRPRSRHTTAATIKTATSMMRTTIEISSMTLPQKHQALMQEHRAGAFIASL
jgi:hypothetical protein